MLVNGDFKKRLTKEPPEPTLTDSNFHKVEMKLKAATGDMEVYFDKKLVMKAQDRTFTAGYIGVGSFDDFGSFDDVWIKGKVVESDG